MLMVLLWALLASPVPTSLRGGGVLVVAFLLGLAVALNQTTSWKTWRRPSQLDERESQLRDRAFRLAFRSVGAGLFLLIVTASVSSILRSLDSGSDPLAFPNGPRYLLAFLLLLALLPSVVHAWLEQDQLDGPSGRHDRGRGVRTVVARVVAPVLTALIVAGVWIAAVAILPPRFSQVVQNPSPSFGYGGAHCETLAVSRELGAGLGSAITVDVDVCWDGREAWDGSQRKPPTDDGASMTAPAKTCSLRLDATDFQDISKESCTEQDAADGTFHLVARAEVSPELGIGAERTLQASLTVNWSGRVLHSS
ncbi:MAG: hypothetical protein ACRENX_12690 [Candidatus Dormibacteria bacterium]